MNGTAAGAVAELRGALGGILRVVRVMPLLLVVGCASGGGDGPQEGIVRTGAGDPAGPPFSAAVRTGDLIFLSGTIGNVPGEGGVVPGGIEPETRQALENIRRVLATVGGRVEDIVKCTVFLVDFGDYRAMNRVYAEFFGSELPARSTVAGTGLARGARVEIECIAAAR